MTIITAAEWRPSARSERRGVEGAKLLVGPLLTLALITVGMAVDGTGPPSVLRHLYLVPTLWAAFTAGARGGSLTGFVAGLLQAPFALPAIERLGLGAQSVDGLVSMVAPVAFGWMTGRLGDQSRARAVRLRAILDLQRTLSRDLSLQDRLHLVAEQVRAALGAERVALVIGSASDARVVASAPPALSFSDASAVAWTLRMRRAMFVEDLHGDGRFVCEQDAGPVPVRGLVVPLDSGSELIGALAVERAGSFPVALRAATGEIALHLALAVDNARLALRQRRFTEELEEKVAAATDRLRELDQAKSEFVSVVAHELRTPLTALQGFSELLLSRAVPPERAARFLCHLHNEAQRLGRIVGELLDLSRIETGRPLELKREPLDVSELLERNVELFAAQHRSHRFHWTAYAGAPALHADRDAVDRMLKNLISNAVKYSPDGGRVSVTAGAAGDRPGMIELAVEDDGVGIPARHLPRIFDKYIRVSSPRTATVRGLGLGLALVRALAEAHGGVVEVESLPGKGSRFRVLLPA
jgi:signal transduction histidine kinase